MEFVSANVVRRVLCIIRTEHYRQLEIRRARLAAHQVQTASGDSAPTVGRGAFSPRYSGSSGTGSGILHGRSSRKQGSRSPSTSLATPVVAGPGGMTAVTGISSRRDVMSGTSVSIGGAERGRLPRPAAARRGSWASQRVAPSMAMYFDPNVQDVQADLRVPLPTKHSIFEGISELIAEIDSPWSDAEHRAAHDFFLQDDVVLTYGYSLAVENVLKAVHRKKGPLRVVVAGGDPERGGEKMASNLAADGMAITYIGDAAVFAVMSRIDKVVMGTVAVLSSGGAVTIAGGHNVALAAKAFSKPVIVMAPLFKLTHLPIFDHHRRNELLPPSFMLPGWSLDEAISVRIPLYDYIPSTLLNIFITDIGPVSPCYLYSLTKQRYHLEDLDLWEY
eukprot:GHVT01049538.1.p1 GENE.GHVT01049538.1~~GHVT01049538.1.p1  ORF type:complete len:390 (+),score=39.68 GHVT01049538.1:1235-2404(+)